MENKLKLLDEFSNFLSNLPEHGIGYQIVDIELKNGEILKDRIVFNTIFETNYKCSAYKKSKYKIGLKY